MQVRGLPRQIIRAGILAAKIDAGAAGTILARRRDALRRWRQAIADGLSAEAAAHAVGYGRATLYRWQKRPEPRSKRPHTVRRPQWSCDLRRAVETLRRKYPMWGKAKLGPILRQQGYLASDATVGRILGRLFAKGTIAKVPTLRRRPHSHRWTAQRHYAVRLPKGLKPDKPGGLIQIDTVFINLAPGRTAKHFNAYCPVAKWTVAKAFNRATAHAASRFLDFVIAEMPFTVKAIQVDGGSEFKAEFEEACRQKGLALYELPPKRPQLNGAVERCNGAWRQEFYEVYDLPSSVEALNPLIQSFQNLYNHFRPHGALAGATPAQYLSSLQAREPAPSHMP